MFVALCTQTHGIFDLISIDLQGAVVEGDPDKPWIRFSLPALLAMLDQRYGDLGALAEQFYQQHVQPAQQKGLLIGPSSGTNYLQTPCFSDRRMLAIQLFFDAVVTCKNALGRAAVKTRKYYVISVRIANIAATMRDADNIMPIAIVPVETWDSPGVGFNGIVGVLESDFALIHDGTHARLIACLCTRIRLSIIIALPSC